MKLIERLTIIVIVGLISSNRKISKIAAKKSLIL
jgi:hypothetical protein